MVVNLNFDTLTESQVQTWSSDPNQYVADEDDVTYSCRISGALLLEELVVIFEVDGLRLILEAVQHRLTEAAQAKVQGHVDWWKLREAAILAIGTVAGSLHKAKVGLIPLVFWTHNHSKNLHL
jgi:hypothetical protein